MIKCQKYEGDNEFVTKLISEQITWITCKGLQVAEEETKIRKS